MKISKSYVALTQARNNIFEKVNIKSMGKKELKSKYFISKINVCGQESDTVYSSNIRGVVNEG